MGRAEQAGRTCRLCINQLTQTAVGAYLPHMTLSRVLARWRYVPVAMLLAAGFSNLGIALVIVAVAGDSGLIDELLRAPIVEPVVWVQILIGTALFTWAFTPAEIGGWLHARNLSPEVSEPARLELRRTRTLRSVPAFAGFSFGFATLAAANMAAASFGDEAPATKAIASRASGDSYWPGGVTLALAGYLIGTLLAEARRRRPMKGTDHAASLIDRQPRRYLTPTARRLPYCVAAVLVVLTLIRQSHGSEASVAAWLLILLAIGLVVGVRGIEWWVVQRRQRIANPALIDLDNTFRSSAAHAIAGGASALGLAAISSLSSDIGWWNDFVGGSFPAWLAVPLALAMLVITIAIVGVWSRYGSGHIGVRPTRPDVRS